MSASKTKKYGFIKAGLIAAYCFCCSLAQAQEITAINFNGAALGKVIPDGKVVSFDNRLLGKVTADSLIINDKGDIIGGVVPQGVAIGNDIGFLGKVGNDGSVRSPSGQIVGKVLPNGLVVNEYFDVLGQVVFPGLVYDDGGKISGRITGDGLYTNLEGQQIGVVTPDGYAYRKVGNDYLLDGRLISSKMVVSLSGEFIGSVVPGGQVTDFNSETIGRVKANGFVSDDNGVIIGKTVSSGYAFDENGRYLGFVSYDGEVLSQNKVVGKMRADGLIVGTSGEIIGRYTDFAATATDLSGRYLGRLLPNGKVAKANTDSGTAGARGIIKNSNGTAIGVLAKTGPVFDYKGQLRGHAISNGSVVSLNGTTIGYMIGYQAYDLSGVMIGEVLPPKAVYGADNAFVGMSGVSSSLNYKGGKWSVSPLGYVFAQNGKIEGKAKDVDTFYTPYGSVWGYQGLNGQIVNNKGIELGQVVGLGCAVNPQNQLSAQTIPEYIAVNAEGEYLGLPNSGNLLLNKSSDAVAKILPDGSVTDLKVGNLNYTPKIGQAYAGRAVLDFEGNLLGYADILGNVNNVSGAKIGHLVERRLAVDNNGIVVGWLSEWQGAVDDKCNALGVVAASGGIYNYRGVYVGKILDNGTVVSDSGATLGYAVAKQPVIDFNGKIMGYPFYNGHVANEKGDDLGCLDASGQLHDGDGRLIGQSLLLDSVINFSGKIAAYMTMNGLSVNEEGQVNGYQQPNGNVNSSSGLPMGAVLQYRFAFGMDNRFLGYVDSKGEVLDAKGKVVGSVDFDGYVVAKGDNIGYALYDLYVYDKDKIVGLINRNGEVFGFNKQNLGRFDRGFVLKGETVVARGNRDYNIRDAAHQVLGLLRMDGTVVNAQNEQIGTLGKAGSIDNMDGEKIAQATPLQFYSLMTMAKKPLSTKPRAVYDKKGDLMGYTDDRGNVVDAAGNVVGKVLADGSAVDLNGNVLSVKAVDTKAAYDADGQLVGYVDERGNIVDAAGNVVGKVLADGSAVDLNGNVLSTGNQKNAQAGKRLQATYDENGNLIGYVDENGNVVDAYGNVVGKVLADGSVVDLNGNVLATKATAANVVYDTNGQLVGYVDDNGNVVDAAGNIVAQINDAGEAVDATGNIIGRVERKWFDKTTIVENAQEQPKQISPALERLEKSKYYKSLGIALTPDGDYLGDILENDTVVDEKGNVIGYRMPDGLIIDDDGNLIGTEELPDNKTTDKNGVFVPAGTFGPGGAYGVGEGVPGNLGPGGGYGPGERYDPTRRAALTAAMTNRRQNISVGKISSGARKEAFDGYQKDWSEQGIPKSISSWRVDMSEMIFSDKPIPAVIARSIDTNNPAPVTAYVERNVYAEEGRNVIIPAGSRLIGAFGSITAAAEATSESARVQISWERLIRPDGSIFVFSGQTADAQGRAGALGYVDQQLFKKYTLPVVTTVLTSATSYFIAAADDSAGSVETSKQQAANDARQNFLDDMESLFDEILADKTDVKAMTYIPAGTRIIIYPNTDLWLRTAERDQEESQNYQKPEILIDDTKMQQASDQQKRDDVARAASGGSSVVYDPDDAEVESAASENKPLLIDTPTKKKTATLAPPPPNSGAVSTSGTTVPVTTTTGSSSSEQSGDSSIPALF
jgi:YD repeat-containing protein